jgi:hypothetical protein
VGSPSSCYVFDYQGNQVKHNVFNNFYYEQVSGEKSLIGIKYNENTHHSEVWTTNLFDGTEALKIQFEEYLSTLQFNEPKSYAYQETYPRVYAVSLANPNEKKTLIINDYYDVIKYVHKEEFSAIIWVNTSS